jgi:branched-chain amino acid transport system substrate-binding protein
MLRKYVGVGILTLAMVASYAGTGLAAKVIKIGAVYPLTGDIASTGQDCKSGVELALDIINGKYNINIPFAKTAGIPSLGGAKLKVMFADSQGSPQTGIGAAEYLISNNKVKAMVGAYQSAVTKTVSQVTERMHIPMVCSDSTSTLLTHRGFHYFFRVNPNVAIGAKDQFQFLQAMRKQGHKIKRVALVYENTEWGSSVAKHEKIYAKKYGYQIVADVPYSHSTTDVSSEVARIMASHPDVVIENSYVSDAILYTEAFKRHNFKPQGLLAWTGHTQRDYLKTVGPDANYFIVLSSFNLGMAKKIPAIKEVNALYRKKFGHDMSENAVRSFNAPFVLADAINRAHSTKAEAIQKALLTTNMSAGIMPWKGIKFDKNHQNIYASLILQQMVNQKYQSVWPFNVATMKVVWPFPGWAK